MLIEYSKYTIDELFEVYESIDKDAYPERFQSLCDEIEIREQNGELKKRQQEIEAYSEEEDEYEFVIEFSSEKGSLNRKLFITAFLVINALVLYFLLPKYFVSDLSDVHKYDTEIDFIECLKEEVFDDETDEVHSFYDLNIRSFQDDFYALGIEKSLCQKLAKDLSQGDQVSIWHEQGMIFQLETQNKTPLSYNYMKPKIRDIQTHDVSLFWVALVALWALFFKSLINAFIPGTYTSD